MEHYELLREYVLKMRNITSSDTEINHVEADTLLCELLSQLGFDEVVKEFDKINKWYA